MFEALRKRLTDTINSFAKREETKGAAAEAEKPIIAEKQEAKPKVELKLTTKIKKVFVSRITLSSAEIDGFAESLKEPMLRSDVSYSATDEFLRDLKSQLAERRISSGRIDEEVTDVVRGALMQTLNSGPKAGLRELVEQHIAKGAAPVKILFLGPNGAGKTTTIAKLAYTFKMQGMSSVLAASDTFRAAAIEQLELHAKRIGVPIIKSKYGADPASVAFDAIAHAKSNGIQLVLIDSAGRQETNKSLISEIEKIARVCKPDITIFIGESTAGNVISEQISEFGKHVRIDGIILTKLDCDAKGGNALSIAKTTGVPILFFGVGEGYDALMPYSSEFVVNAILPSS
jgi:fused signal recognition particle receptor